jgi:outer membrane lipoprotein-sorting protein
MLVLALVMLAQGTPRLDKEAVLNSLAAAGKALKTMTAEFTQTKVSALLNEKEEMSGTLHLEIPGRFRWDYTSPQESVMLIKDGSFARYFPRTKQVFKGKAKGEADLLVGFGPGAQGLGKKYDVTLVGEETIGGRPSWIVDLKPKGEHQASALFKGIRLWVDEARSIPCQTQLTEPTDDYTTIRFEHVLTNPHLPSGSFDLKLPKDVVEVR